MPFNVNFRHDNAVVTVLQPSPLLQVRSERCSFMCVASRWLGTVKHHGAPLIFNRGCVSGHGESGWAFSKCQPQILWIALPL